MVYVERPIPPIENSGEGQRKTMPEGQALKEKILALRGRRKKGVGIVNVHASGRRVSESRMRENLT